MCVVWKEEVDYSFCLKQQQDGVLPSHAQAEGVPNIGSSLFWLQLVGYQNRVSLVGWEGVA